VSCAETGIGGLRLRIIFRLRRKLGLETVDRRRLGRIAAAAGDHCIDALGLQLRIVGIRPDVELVLADEVARISAGGDGLSRCQRSGCGRPILGVDRFLDRLQSRHLLLAQLRSPLRGLRGGGRLLALLLGRRRFGKHGAANNERQRYCDAGCLFH
jgi:hypothetical protein